MLKILLCCAGLDGDVHALMDEQIKLKFSTRYTRTRLKCKFEKNPLNSEETKKKNSERKTKTLE